MVVGPLDRLAPLAAVDGLPSAEILALRVAGAVGGAVIALALVPAERHFPPDRIVVSLISGIVGAAPLRDYLGWERSPDNIVAAACFIAAVSWWSWQAIIAALQAGWLWRRKG